MPSGTVPINLRNSSTQQTALIEALLGEIPIKGKLPVKLPDPYANGVELNAT